MDKVSREQGKAASAPGFKDFFFFFGLLLNKKESAVATRSVLLTHTSTET